MTAPTIHTKRVAQSVSDMVQEWFSKFDVPHMTTDLFENRLARFQNESTPTTAYVAGLEDALRRGASDPYFGELDAESGFAVIAALSARPDAPDVRTVTVAQLERWATEWANTCDAMEEDLRSVPFDRKYISEIRAIIGGMK